MELIPTYPTDTLYRPSLDTKTGITSPLSVTDTCDPSLTESKNIQLRWQEPQDTGGLPLTEYVIERRGGPIYSIAHEWIPILTLPASSLTATIPFPSKSFEKTSPYYYRVRAVNRMGLSSPLETTRPIEFDFNLLNVRPRSTLSSIEYKSKIPAAPRGPLKLELLPQENRVHLEWSMPETSRYKLDELSSKPSRYIIEASEADKPDSVWIELARVPSSSTSSTVRLLPSSTYDVSFGGSLGYSPLLYRVRAENDVGSSAPLVGRIEPMELGSERPKWSPGTLEAHLIYKHKQPQFELKWPRALMELSTYESGREFSSSFGPDLTYLLQYRTVGQRGWKTVATLPYGQQSFVYRPKIDEFQTKSRLSKPIQEAFQFRIGPQTSLGVGEFLESSILSWKPYEMDTGTVASARRLPGLDYGSFSFDQTFVPSPERFQLVDVSVNKPSSFHPRPVHLGSIVLKWHPSTEMSSALRSNADFIVESWRPDKLDWWPVAKRSASVSDETGPGRYELQIDELPVGKTYHFRVITCTTDGRRSEPTLLAQPVHIPTPDVEIKGRF